MIRLPCTHYTWKLKAGTMTLKFDPLAGPTGAIVRGGIWSSKARLLHGGQLQPQGSNREPYGVREGVGVGGSPVIAKRPDIFQVVPRKICTSYSPGSQPRSGVHSV